MHVSGDAERAILGLASKGVMYAAALKMIKEQFGQPSIIACALVNNVAKGEKISRSHRKKLREFSIDLINCMATMKCIGYTADINANENLQKIITRLPDHMIERWKVFVADICDLQRDSKPPRSDHPPRRGIYAVRRDSNRLPMKCYVCEEEHHTIECPVLAKASVLERLKLAKKTRLCFLCLNHGHSKNDCQSKKKCEKSDSCPYFHHPFLPSSPPPVASILDKANMMPVIRARFRAPNDRVCEGNMLIDSGAGTTVIWKLCEKCQIEWKKRMDRFSSSWRREIRATTQPKCDLLDLCTQRRSRVQNRSPQD
ncbi:Retrovirus-related Pol poly from transposon [Paramuricea clavata]|uniref:Retrovirus-related Pol poly from transposon n=1 Tax=Paramuricea clavata TaxID=317549 RepID=A0A7D9JR11_PARCT|nr:Retrovirus-related Pol poly from transposon [Paramuricea clavata]